MNFIRILERQDWSLLVLQFHDGRFCNGHELSKLTFTGGMPHATNEPLHNLRALPIVLDNLHLGRAIISFSCPYKHHCLSKVNASPAA